MFSRVHNFRVVEAVCVLFFLSALPLVALSQEDFENEQETVTEQDVEISSTPTAPEVVVDPYKTEKLSGDRVLGDFVLAPGKIEVVIAPGETKTVLINVANRIGEPKTFNIDVEDLAASTDPKKSVVLLGDDTGPYTLKDYISVPQIQFELDHNRRAIIPVTISIPADADPGGRYGSVLVKTVTQEADIASTDSTTIPSSAIVSRIGTLFFITIAGDTEVEGEMKDFSVNNGKKWFTEGPINFEILFKNTGSVHLNPYGELRITNMFNDEVGFVELDPWFTLPQSERLREIVWNREFLYGKYTATMYLNRGYDDIIDEITVSFWVIPWKIALGGLGGLFVFFFIIRGFFRKFEFKRK